jgi:hypothetical protein
VQRPAPRRAGRYRASPSGPGAPSGSPSWDEPEQAAWDQPARPDGYAPQDGYARRDGYAPQDAARPRDSFTPPAPPSSFSPTAPQSPQQGSLGSQAPLGPQGPYSPPQSPYAPPDQYASPAANAPRNPYRPQGPQGPYDPRGPQGPYDPHGPENLQNPQDPQDPDNPEAPGARKNRKRRRGWVRRTLRRPTVRIIGVLLALLLCWCGFSVGQALASPNGGSMASKLAEWARDHYLGPVVTLGEWIIYSPPQVGGKPSFSLAAPASAQPKVKAKKHGFEPIIPKRLSSPAGSPLPGEGVWRVLETVKGQPAMFGTFLRPDSVHTSYVAGIVSMDQRLLTFQLHPGAEDPGPGNWKSQPYIPAGSRSGLMATFNGGFKLNEAEGGFYLNGVTGRTLVNGAASMVYYKNGDVKIGAWGQGVRMTKYVVGVRQNLKLIVENGKVPASVNQNVLGSWGATLGGGYYVWRSGIGITKDGRLIFVYGPALDVQTLAGLLQRAGAVEGMQLDINPFWMSFESYHADGHPSDPTPTNLLPTQQQTAYRYYSVYSRDFTAVYAR